jgi:hypothetical protein
MGRHNIEEEKQLKQRQWLRILVWTLFGIGLLVQALAPRLRIVNHTFIIPSTFTPRSGAIDPAAIIARERIMQLFSAIFTLSGAFGLGLYYRPVLVRRRSH